IIYHTDIIRLLSLNISIRTNVRLNRAESRHLTALADVRFTPESGLMQCSNACLLWANSGHCKRRSCTGRHATDDGPCLCIKRLITDAFHFRQRAFLPWLRLLHTCMRHFAYVRSPYDPQNDRFLTRDWTKQPYQNDIALLPELRFCIGKLQPLRGQHQLLPWTTLKSLGLAPYCRPSCTELHRLLLLFPWPD